MSFKDVLLVLLVLVCAGLAIALVRRRRAPEPELRRILFPFAGGALSEPVLGAALRLARLEHATLVPAYLAIVPMTMPLEAPIVRECDDALPLLEAIEQRAARAGVAVDSRIERGRTYRHALRELLAHERYDRIVVAADTNGDDGFGAGDVAWLLEHADGELLVLRPANDRPLAVASAA
jgi:hypothetical protein